MAEACSGGIIVGCIGAIEYKSRFRVLRRAHYKLYCFHYKCLLTVMSLKLHQKLDTSRAILHYSRATISHLSQFNVKLTMGDLEFTGNRSVMDPGFKLKYSGT